MGKSMFMYSNLFLVCFVLLIVIMYWKQNEGRNQLSSPLLSHTENFEDGTELSGADLVLQSDANANYVTEDDYGKVELSFEPNIIANLRRDIVHTSDDSRECAIYSIAVDDTKPNPCDSGYFNLSYYLLNKYINATSVVSSDLSAIQINAAVKNEMIEVKSYRDTNDSTTPCKISFRNWTMPITRNGVKYPIVDLTASQTLSIGPDSKWPQCYRTADSDADAIGYATQLERNLSKVDGSSLVVPTNVAKTPYSNGGKYAEVSFNTASTSDITDDMLCSISLEPVIDVAKKFMKITVDPTDKIKSVSFVDYNPRQIPHLTTITAANDVLNIKRRMYAYTVDNRSLMMLPMIYADSRIYQLEVDKCDRVSKVSILNTTNERDSTNPSTVPFSLFQHFGFGATRSERIYYSSSTTTIQGMADKLKIGDFTVASSCMTALDSAVTQDFRDLVNRNLHTSFNTFGASSFLKELKTNMDGVFYVSIGDNLAPTKADIDKTTEATPPVTITNGVTSCVSDIDAVERGYMDGDMLARDVCSIAYKGWTTASSTDCKNNTYKKYTCANDFTVSDGVTQIITNDEALHRNYIDAQSAANEVCMKATYNTPNGIKYYKTSIENTDGSSTYECLRDPGDVTTYIGKDIIDSRDSSRYYVDDNSKLQRYSADGADYYESIYNKQYQTVEQPYATTVFPNDPSKYYTDNRDIPYDGDLFSFYTSTPEYFYMDPESGIVYYFIIKDLVEPITIPQYNSVGSRAISNVRYQYIYKKCIISTETVAFYRNIGYSVKTLPKYYASSIARIPSYSRTFNIYDINGVYKLPWNDNQLITLSVNSNPTRANFGVFTYSSWFYKTLYIVDQFPSNFRFRMQENPTTLTDFTWDFENLRFVCNYLYNNGEQHNGRTPFSYLTKIDITPQIMSAYSGIYVSNNRIYRVALDVTRSSFVNYRLVSTNTAEQVSDASITLFGNQLQVIEIPFYYEKVLNTLWRNSGSIVHDVNRINGTYPNTFYNNDPNRKYEAGNIRAFNPSGGLGRTNGIVNTGYGDEWYMEISHISFPDIDIHLLNNIRDGRPGVIAAHWNYKTESLRWNICATWSKTSSTALNGDKVPNNCPTWWMYN